VGTLLLAGACTREEPADDGRPASAAHHLELVPFDEGLPREGQWQDGFAIADLDRDGHLDLVHAGPRGPAPRPIVFLGNGAGRWRRWEAASFPPLSYAYGDVAVADFDADGLLDLALGMHATGIAVLRGEGAGRFVPWDMAAPVSSFSTRALVAADLTADGRPDVVALGEGPRTERPPSGTLRGSYGLRLLQLRSDGDWVEVDLQPGSRRFGAALAAADLDGDGRRDLVTASHVAGDRDLLLLAARDGQWRPQPLDVPPAAWTWAVAVAELSGDGRTDIVVAHLAHTPAGWETGIDILVARADGGFTARALHREAGRPGITAIGVGNLDASGASDIAAADARGRVLVFRDGHGPPAVFDGEAGCRASRIVVSDLDGDGCDEIVASFAGVPTRSGPAGGGCLRGGAIRAWTPATCTLQRGGATR